jgi:zinc D-Ala-D-Ala carboxypeptidase
MKLSEHFELREFTRNSHGLANEPPEDVIPILREFCEQVLDPLRVHLARPVVITSGYRSSELNRRVGGTPDSYHRATPIRCAADVQVPGISLGEVFRWLCEESRLPFDKVILERGKRPDTEVDDCIHIQYRSDRPRRLAYLGPTHGQGAYTQVEVHA